MPKKSITIIGLTITLLKFFIQNYLYAVENKTGGEEVDPSIKTIEYNGKAYGFCCSRCESKFSKDPGKYSSNLSEDGKKYIKEK